MTEEILGNQTELGPELFAIVNEKRRFIWNEKTEEDLKDYWDILQSKPV